MSFSNPPAKSVTELNLSLDESMESQETIPPATIFREFDCIERDSKLTRANPVKDLDSSMESDDMNCFHPISQTEELHEQEVIEWRLHPIVDQVQEPGQSIDFSSYFPVSRQDIMDCDDFSISSHEVSFIDLEGMTNPADVFGDSPRASSQSPAQVSINTREEPPSPFSPNRSSEFHF